MIFSVPAHPDVHLVVGIIWYLQTVLWSSIVKGISLALPLHGTHLVHEKKPSYTNVASPSEVFLSPCFAILSRYKNFRLFIHELHIVYCSQIPWRPVNIMSDSLPPPPLSSMVMGGKMTGKVSFFLPNVFSSFLFNFSLFKNILKREVGWG